MEDLTRLQKLPEALLPWYAANARDLPWRRDQEPYHVWLSEIMLQQTRVEAVRNYYRRFLSALPDISALAAAPEDQLLKLWEGLGYYTRVKNLQKAARQVQERHGGHFPRDHAAVLDLAGIGDYTAGAICSICFGQPTPAVDGNVLRVIARLTAWDAPADTSTYKKYVTAALAEVYPQDQAGSFTQALMELGATVCIPNGAPRCEACPCAVFCAARARGCQLQLPVRSPKRPRRKERLTVFLLEHEGHFALEKRPGTGLLAGLWQFPNTPALEDDRAALDWCVSQGLHPTALLSSRLRSHIFTHVEWEMTCLHIRCAAPSPDYTWADPGDYPLPTAFRRLLEDLPHTPEPPLGPHEGPSAAGEK